MADCPTSSKWIVYKHPQICKGINILSCKDFWENKSYCFLDTENFIKICLSLHFPSCAVKLTPRPPCYLLNTWQGGEKPNWGCAKGAINELMFFLICGHGTLLIPREELVNESFPKVKPNKTDGLQFKVYTSPPQRYHRGQTKTCQKSTCQIYLYHLTVLVVLGRSYHFETCYKKKESCEKWFDSWAPVRQLYKARTWFKLLGTRLWLQMALPLQYGRYTISVISLP